MEWSDAWTPLWRLGVWQSLFPSLLDLLCPGQQPETWFGSSGVKQGAGASRRVPALGAAAAAALPSGIGPRLPADAPQAAAALRLKALAFIYSPLVFPSLC